VPEPLDRWQRRWRVWSSLTLLEQCLLPPSWCLLGLAAIVIHLVAFRRLAPLLGRSLGPGTFNALPTEQQRLRAMAIGRSVQLAARHTPWASLCQAQAIVARCWLGVLRIPYVINYGVRKNPLAVLEAHAWVCVGSLFVTGGDGHAGYVVVGAFAGGARKPPLIN